MAPSATSRLSPVWALVIVVLAVGNVALGWQWLTARHRLDRVEAQLRQLTASQPPPAGVAAPQGDMPASSAPMSVAAPPTAAPAASPQESAPQPSPSTPSASEQRDYLTWDEVRDTLSQEVERQLPNARLSAAEMDELTDAVVAMREAQEMLRGLSFTTANASELQRLRAQVVESAETFSRITGRKPGQFLQEANGGGAIDNDQPEQGEVVFEPLSAYRP